MRFLVTGASGTVGGAVVAALLERDHQVRALTRPGSATALPPGVERVVGDLNRPRSLESALAAADGVFLLPGFEDMPGVLSVAREARVKRVVLLSGLSAASGDQTNAISAYMIRSEAAAVGSGLPWTILRPCAFMSNALRWVPQLRAGDTISEPFADVRSAVIDPYDIAAVAANALCSDDLVGERLALSGPQALLPSERVQVLARVLGRDLRLEALPDAEARAQLRASMSAEYVDAFFDFYRAGGLDESRVLPTVEKLLGRASRTFDQWASAHIAAFKIES